LEGTAKVVSTPDAPIDAYVVGETLQVGVTVEVLPSLHEAVAAYVPELLSFTDAGPEIDSPVSVGGTFTIVTPCDAVCVTPPEV
jgi:hypothetical protein